MTDVLFTSPAQSATKPYTGEQSVVADLVARIGVASQKMVDDIGDGEKPDTAMKTLVDTVDKVRDAFLGKDPAYEAMKWQSDGSLAAHLVKRYSLTSEPDPVGAILMKLALNSVVLYRRYITGESNPIQTRLEAGALTTEAVRDMLGLPDDSSDGDGFRAPR